MIKILAYRPLNGQFLQGSFDAQIADCNDLILRDCLYFRKNNQRWILLSSTCFEKNGQKKYYELISFQNKKFTENLKHIILKSIEEFLEKTAKTPIDLLF